MKGVPFAPEAVRALLIVGAPGFFVKVRVRAALPAPKVLVADIDTMNVPSAVGVPVIMPVDVSTERPAGRFCASKEVGELLAVIW